MRESYEEREDANHKPKFKAENQVLRAPPKP